MRKRRKDFPIYGVMVALFTACLIQALLDPTDKATHLRAYIYGAGALVAVSGLVLKLRNKI